MQPAFNDDGVMLTDDEGAHCFIETGRERVRWITADQVQDIMARGSWSHDVPPELLATARELLKDFLKEQHEALYLRPFDEADSLLADMEGVEAVYEGRRIGALSEEEQLLELDDVIRKAARAGKRDRS